MTDSGDSKTARPAGANRCDKAWCEVPAVAAAVVALTGFVWLARGELGPVWDEPPGIERQHAMRDWLADVFGPPDDRARAFSRDGLEQGWPFAREVPHEHPPVYAILSFLTWQTTEWLLGPLRSHRLATVVMFALAAGVLFRLVRARWGWLPAAAALGALLFNPRLFAHAQLATTDVIMSAFWFLAAVAFLRSCETGRKRWLFGVLAGLALMTKVAGVLLLPAMLVWCLLYRPRGAWRVWAWSLPAVPLVMWAVHPGWWTNPAGGVARWVRALADYQQKVPVYYLGHVYDSRSAHLPWHNSIVLTGTTVPVGLLALGLLGVAVLAWQSARGRRRAAGAIHTAEEHRFLPDQSVAGLALLNFLALIVLRIFPFMPAHDGLRHLLPAFFFLPVLAAYGVHAVRQTAAAARRTAIRQTLAFSLLPLALMLCLGTAAWSTLRVHPYELAYYNALIGGPPGAKAAGMETTYYWDAAGRPVLDWMNEHLPERATVLIAPPPDVRTFGWLQRWGRLRADLRMQNLQRPEQLNAMLGDELCYLVLLMRQGLYMPRSPDADDLFARLAEADALYELAPPEVGVRLLAIFDRQAFRKIIDDNRPP